MLLRRLQTHRGPVPSLRQRRSVSSNVTSTDSGFRIESDQTCSVPIVRRLPAVPARQGWRAARLSQGQCTLLVVHVSDSASTLSLIVLCGQISLNMSHSWLNGGSIYADTQTDSLGTAFDPLVASSPLIRTSLMILAFAHRPRAAGLPAGHHHVHSHGRPAGRRVSSRLMIESAILFRF